MAFICGICSVKLLQAIRPFIQLVPTTRCQSVKQGSVLSYNSALSRESGAQSRSSFGQFSLGLGHKPWKFAVFFGVTGPESTFFSDTVSLISAEE